MAESIAAALRRIKQEPRAVIDASVAESVCRELGLSWRQTELTPPVTIALLAQQVLGGNISNPELIRQAGLTVTPAAYCTAKGRVPVEALRRMSRRVCDAAEREVQQDAADRYRWKGHRTWHIDGSSFSMPDTPQLQRHFGHSGRQKAGCGFPTAHLLCLFSAETGLVRDVIASPLRTGELTDTPRIHENLRGGDLVVGDTAFGSYFHIAMLSSRGVFGVFPNHQKRIVSFRPHRRHAHRKSKQRRSGQPTSRWIKRLSKDDQLVEYFKPDQHPAWMSRQQYDAMPQSIIVREIRRTVYKSGFRPMSIVIVTTLLDKRRYPADEIVHLLKQRWNIETNLRHLKTTMNMDVLRCHSIGAVEKELWTFLLVYNLVRVIMLEASVRQDVDVTRVSFADALYWMRHAQPGHGHGHGHGHGQQSMPDLIINPLRPNRVEPRVIKRRPKKYGWLSKPRPLMRKALMARRLPLF